MLVGPCPAYPTGASDLVLGVCRVDRWPLAPDASVASAEAWLAARPTLECVAARHFSRLVGLACVYAVTADDPSYSAWLSSAGLPADRLLAVGGLLVDPSARSRGVAEDLVTCALSRVRAFGRVPVAATVLDVPGPVLKRLGLRDAGVVDEYAGRPVRALVGR